MHLAIVFPKCNLINIKAIVYVADIDRISGSGLKIIELSKCKDQFSPHLMKCRKLNEFLNANDKSDIIHFS